MTTALLRKLLPNAGYAVSFRTDGWTECFAEREAERWRGRGLDEDDALEDVLRQMFPSALAREFLDGRRSARTPRAAEGVAPPTEASTPVPAQPPPAPTPGDSPPLAAPGAETPASGTAAVRSRRVVAAAKTDPGTARVRNEDACLVLPGRGLVAVADGLATQPAREVASAMVVEVLRSAFEDAAPLSPVRTNALPMLVDALKRANAAIFNRGRLDSARRGMAASVAAALIVGRSVVLAHVGDCRIYRLRRGVLGLLTNDHSANNARIRSGKPGGANAGAVTRALGAKRTVEVEATVATVQPGDALLLCTAGLHGVVGHGDLAAVLAQHAAPASAVEEFLARGRALEAPSNVTAAVVRWEG